ncbi:MAG: SpoIIE family protein phosphatase [Clostridia bacterium]|nr:SpoIIE family protein phosphatase [Clostridia bacterium]
MKKKRLGSWFKIFVIIAFAASFFLTFMLQTNTCNESAANLMSQKLDTTKTLIEENHANRETITQMSNDNALVKARAISMALVGMSEFDSALLIEFCSRFDVDEIHIINYDAIITATTVPEYIGYDMNSAEQSQYFVPILQYPNLELVQDARNIGFDNETIRQFAAVSLPGHGMVQIGYTPERISAVTSFIDIENLAETLDIGASGRVLITSGGMIMSSPDKQDVGRSLSSLVKNIKIIDSKSGLCSATGKYGNILCMFQDYGDYSIYAIIPESEAYEIRNTTTTQLLLLNLLLFGFILVITSLLAQRRVLKKLVLEGAVIRGETNIFSDNERRANNFAATCMFVFAGLSAIMWILTTCGFLGFDKDAVNLCAPVAILAMSAPSALFIFKDASNSRMKYFVLALAIATVAFLNVYLSVYTMLLFILPILLSCHYFSRRFTYITTAAVLVFMAVSTFAGVYLGQWNSAWDAGLLQSGLEAGLNGAAPPLRSFNKEFLIWLMTSFYLPQALILVSFTPLCAMISTHTHNLLAQQVKDTKERQRIGAELSIATQIQTSTLPCIFPPYPDRKEFSIFAQMRTAKEVGGDFYDFFFVDEDNLAIVIADVSGKGVPAALFMMISRILIKTFAQQSLSPSEIFTKTNEHLCEDNATGMFVTAWLGIFNIKTGVIRYVNAGHNKPLIRRASRYDWLNAKPCFVLGGMEAVKYTEHETRLEAGDALFLYTDGVTEACNMKQELFSDERLISLLNSADVSCLNPDALLPRISREIDTFAEGAEQADDITMLGVKFLGEPQ